MGDLFDEGRSFVHQEIFERRRADVVEAVHRVVQGEEAFQVEFYPQQIANGVRVLDVIQAPHHDATWVAGRSMGLGVRFAETVDRKQEGGRAAQDLVEALLDDV